MSCASKFLRLKVTDATGVVVVVVTPLAVVIKISEVIILII